VSNDKDSPQNVNTPGAPHADITIPHGAVDPLVAYLVRQRMKDGLGAITSFHCATALRTTIMCGCSTTATALTRSTMCLIWGRM
jgi:hypothetical protein